MSINIRELQNGMKCLDIIDHISECILNKIPILFVKYGDGEYNCAKGLHGHNCDNDEYTNKLSNLLKKSFIYISNIPNSYIGLWHSNNNTKFWESLVANNINWAVYHTVIIDSIHDDNFKRKLNLYYIIQKSTLKKYIICNPLLIKSKLLFNATKLIHVPFQNWFDKYFDNLIKFVCQEIGDDEQPIVITCCGMGAKVVIAELHKKFPRGIFLDFGSAIDFICTKRDSRGYANSYTYEELHNLLSHILPDDWHDPQYEPLYLEAKQKMGIHL